MDTQSNLVYQHTPVQVCGTGAAPGSTFLRVLFPAICAHCGLVNRDCSLLPVFPVCAADSIEANVENADAHVHSGTQQLSRAADYQVKDHKKDLNWNNVNKEK